VGGGEQKNKDFQDGHLSLRAIYRPTPQVWGEKQTVWELRASPQKRNQTHGKKGEGVHSNPAEKSWAKLTPPS